MCHLQRRKCSSFILQKVSIVILGFLIAITANTPHRPLIIKSSRYHTTVNSLVNLKAILDGVSCRGKIWTSEFGKASSFMTPWLLDPVAPAGGECHTSLQMTRKVMLLKYRRLKWIGYSLFDWNRLLCFHWVF
jgi:hypothetical protein